MLKRTDINISQCGQLLPKIGHLLLICLDFLALGVLTASLFFGVKSEVLQQYHLPTRCLVDGFFDFLPHAIVCENDALAKQFLQFRNNGFERVFIYYLAVGATEVRHENNGFGAMFGGVLDRREGADYTLIIGHLLGGIERDVEVNLL